MKNLIKPLLIALVVVISGCSKVPVTGRKQMNLLPESTLVGMSLDQYKSFLTEHPAVASSDPNAAMVKNVGAKIASAVTTYLKQNGSSDRVANYKWEFNLVNDPVANAWAMPGGKVVVYSGILPITQDETGLAVVMGHEVAHAIARHGNERMSQMLVTQMGGIALDVALSEKSAQTQQIFQTAYGVGSTVALLLPYSRLHESEADKLGLIFMAMAGYNPQKAVDFWQRMAARSDGPNVPELLSTHPSNETRINDIKAYLPKAMSYYKP